MSIKKTLRELLDRARFEQIAEMAVDKKRVLGSLVSLTFDPEELIVWRAVEAMGLTASQVARRDPEYVRNHLRRLHWLLSEESGGVCWRAPEAMAEIVRHEPELYAECLPIIVSLMTSMAEEDLEHFRAGILWAIGRLGAACQVHVQAVLPALPPALDDSNAQVRGMAVWCLGQVGQAELLADRSDLLCDEGPVDFYEDALLNRTSVCRLLRRALGDADYM